MGSIFSVILRPGTLLLGRLRLAGKLTLLGLLVMALLLGLAYLVLDPTPPRHVVVATRPARSDTSEFGPRTPVCHGAPTRQPSRVRR